MSEADSSEPAAAGRAIPLCVDLDHTLVATDTLLEAVLVCVRRRPATLLGLPLRLLGGRARLKAWLAERGPVDPAMLPYRGDVIAYLEEARAAGRSVVLATAAHRSTAEAVAAHLGLFDAVVASDRDANLKAGRKGDALASAYGEKGFEYLGDARADLAVWERAGQASAVGLSPARKRRLERIVPVERHFPVPRAGWRTWLRALRTRQWVKNVLVFLPLVMSHRFNELPVVGQAMLAFVAFCLISSSVYLANDLLDLPADRQHPTKRRRAFASGTVSIGKGLVLLPLLVGAGLGLSLWLLPPLFTAALLGYLALNVLYSFGLKQVAIADVILLAILYGLRVLAGGIATATPVSAWLIAFCLFFFLNLAFLKRYADLRLLESAEQEHAPGRDYQVGDAALILSLGPASAYMAAVILALYIHSNHVRVLYHRPQALWLLVPLLVYWVSRMWLLAHRGRMTDDPVLFTTRDPASYVVGAGAVAVLVLAALF